MGTYRGSRRTALGQYLGVVAGCLLASLPAPALAAEEPLRLGVIPYLSTRALMGFYEPVRVALESRLGRRVVLETAADYPTFHQRTLAREYDIAISNPVYGRIAQKESGYTPVARAATNLTPLLIVPAASPLKDVAGLSGKTVGITDKTATITQVGQEYLRRSGVRDVTYVVTKTHTNSIAFLERGEVDAAISSVTALKQTAAAARAQVRVLHEIGSRVPPVIYLLAPGRAGLTPRILTEALLDFARSEAGKRYVEALGHENIVPLAEGDMAAVDVFAEELRPLLK